MAGGMRNRRDGTPLWQRAAASESATAPRDPTPCWIGEATPGWVVQWQRTESGQWQALVLAWLPSDQVRPRLGGDQGEGGSDE